MTMVALSLDKLGMTMVALSLDRLGMTDAGAKIANMSLSGGCCQQKTDILTYIFSFEALAQDSLLSRRRADGMSGTLEIE